MPESEDPPTRGANVETDGRQSGAGEPEGTTGPRIDLGVLVAYSPGGDPEALEPFADRMARDATAELRSVTSATWQARLAERVPLPDGRTRRPSEFLDEAALRMVEGPYDLVVVLTDVPLISRSERIVAGLASPVARVAVVSTRKLLIGGRDESPRSLDSEAVERNASTLLLHLLGHVLGADHGDADGGVMEPFRYDPARRDLPSFDADVGAHLQRIATGVPQEEVSRGPLRRLGFHVTSALRNPREVAWALRQSRAPLLPFSLPALATAAVAPTLILVFSAETWDVGLNLDDATAVLFAAVSVLAAAGQLMYVQNLHFPRERRRVLTEHVALVNVSVFLVLVLAMVGLFAVVGAIILAVELIVFPPNLMTNWPSLEDPTVGLVDLVRTAAFISTIGVLTGALAGGLENRAIVRHLALFLDRP